MKTALQITYTSLFILVTNVDISDVFLVLGAGVHDDRCRNVVAYPGYQTPRVVVAKLRAELSRQISGGQMSSYGCAWAK